MWVNLNILNFLLFLLPCETKNPIYNRSFRQSELFALTQNTANRLKRQPQKQQQQQ